MMRRVSSGTRTERGATAVIVALVAFVLFGAAALGVDIANLTMERQELHDAVDAAAQAAAYDLPATTAATTATTFAKANDPDANPTSKLYCMIGANSSNQPISAQVPSTCDPDGTGTYVASGWSCARGICAKLCNLTAPGAKCNTVRVEAKKDVPFMFAPVIGYEKGNTGAVASAACKGSCGNETPNPLDVVIMADRTPSMSTTNRQGMINGIRTMLTTMDPTMQYVAFGALHKSRAPGDSDYNSNCIAQNTLKTQTNSDSNAQMTTASQRGTWLPVPFSNNYLNTDGTLNSSSAMAKALDCVYTGTPSGIYNTHLASPMKAAGRYVLGLDSNNLGSLPGGRPGTVRKVVIFETDGQPVETYTGGASASLSVPGDLAAEGNKQKGCDNFEKIASDYKNEPDTVMITIAFGDANTANCGSGKPVRDMLARSASPHPSGATSVAKDCSNAANKLSVNTDGDFYFCATNGTEMAAIFKTALSQVQKGIRLVNLP